MNLTATHINYYRLCKRKLWLFANNIQLEHTSDLVTDGKLIEEESYLQRSEKYSQVELFIQFEGVNLSGKIDFFDTRNRVVHETKRSNKVEVAHVWQVKFYLWLLQLNEIEAEKGVIEYPRLREKETVFLEQSDIDYLKTAVKEIQELVKSENCPDVINAKICKSCSYYDFCYSGEV
jgi:CRISPR-associated exonuclease Cas4